MSCCNAPATDQAQIEAQKTIHLEFLYLDESTCKPCGGTGVAVDEAAQMVAGPLSSMGMALNVERLHVATRQDAMRHKLEASPTIRINGVDIDPSQTQSDCETCGEIAGGQTKVDCRTWHWKGQTNSSAPVGLIVEAIMAAAVAPKAAASDCCGASGTPHAFALPDNLVSFFDAREANDPNLC